MKPLSLILFLVFIINKHTQAQDKNFRPTYIYDGYIQTSTGKQLPVTMNFLVLLDSTVIGSYYYYPIYGSLKLAGKFNTNYSLSLIERNSQDQNTGKFEGQVSKDRKQITGYWTSPDNKLKHPFSLRLISGMKSFWGYIKKNRALKEYNDISSAIREADKVLSVDLANQNRNMIPDSFIKLRNMVSINLLGNNFQYFPKVLTKLPQIEEISMASNPLKQVDPKIGNLKNLRILILDFCKFDTLPKEIGYLTNLLYLDVSMNKNLRSLPSTIANLKNLQELHMERTSVTEEEVNKIKKQLPNCVVIFN